MIKTESFIPNEDLQDSNVSSIFLNYTIYFGIYIFYRIIYIFNFLNPYITKKFEDFINLIFNKYTFRIKNLYKNLHNKIDLVNEEEFHESEDYEDYKLDKDDINNKVTDLKTMSNTIKSKNKNILKELYIIYFIIFGILILANVIIFMFDPVSYKNSINNLSSSLIVKIIFNIIWITAISFTFNLTATLPYYKDIILKYL
jgi:hypothetical protein